MNVSVRFMVYALFLCGLAGCGAAPGAADDGPPVVDPGGAFDTTVASSRPIGDLTLVEADTLCRDLANAYYSFLGGAVETADSCRQAAVAVTQDALSSSDGGLDGGAICAGLYDDCSHQEPPVAIFSCPVPIPTNYPQHCDATVEDISACLNEIAAFNPLGTCVNKPACDGGSSADAVAPPPAALPACERLYRICPALQGVAMFPC